MKTTITLQQYLDLGGKLTNLDIFKAWIINESDDNFTKKIVNIELHSTYDKVVVTFNDGLEFEYHTSKIHVEVELRLHNLYL